MEVVTKIAPLALALIMLGLGLGLTTQDFKRVINNPKDFSIGLFCQLIILPIIAYILILILKTPVELALGVMIIAAAPGGVTTNVMTKFAKGDVALSISLTAIISLISIFSVPFIILYSAKLLGISNISEEITMTGIAIKMAGVVTIPVILGMVIRKFAENFIVSKIPLIEKITGALFVIVFASIWIEERQNIISYLGQAGMVVLLLNIIMMTIAYYIAKGFATGIEQRKCIAIECGLQNGTLAVFVATQIFNDIIYIVPTAAYALIMYITAFIFMFFVRKTI
tara:strand:- start:11159 stop:12007 length:849 start_codon:yes stop_codon:yes gene_type:complete